MLEAAVKSEKWRAAARLGNATVREIESGGLFTRLGEIADEAKARRLYAVALEHAANPAEAKRERDLAAALLAKNSPETLTARERRVEKLKTELMATKVNRPAAPFRLKNLAGQDVALTDYRGKTLILAFWATWCLPCRTELEELNRLADRFRDDPRAALVTISVDDTASVVSDFASKSGYRFPILKSDGTVESAYTQSTIPQLYVIDPLGNIRFQVTGFENDGLFERRLEWMIDDASR
jgi:peroxiredoxin